ncbi:hypothetical protein FOFC_21247 [Fusarium oxysporum]|nr:hypothetical protein FOFC_21247 [Fusarium oxysporum]
MDAIYSLCQPSDQRLYHHHHWSFPTHLASSHHLRHSSNTSHQPPKQTQACKSSRC